MVMKDFKNKLNIHDPENIYKWYDKTTGWVLYLKIAAFVGGAVSLAVFFWLFTVLMFLI